LEGYIGYIDGATDSGIASTRSKRHHVAQQGSSRIDNRANCQNNFRVILALHTIQRKTQPKFIPKYGFENHRARCLTTLMPAILRTFKMSPHSNIFLLFILLEYSTFTRFILAAEDVSDGFTENFDSNKNDEPDDVYLPIPQNLIGITPPTDNLGVLPEFPQRADSVYFVVAVAGGAKMWGRTLARALLDMGHPFTSPQGPPLRPLYVDLPSHGRFSANVLMSLCHRIDAQPLAGMIVIGDGQAPRALALAGHSMKIPVLWAKGGTANLKDGNRELSSPFQAILQPSSHEILEAIRALFLQTHWHSFFILSDVYSTMVLARRNGGPLKEVPLVPTILPLPANDDHIFRQLAQISRSTRGVVLLLCNIDVARKVMHEAKRLNMIGGHFIWIWADTSSTTEFYNAAYHDISDVIKDTKDLLDRSEYSSKKTDTGSDSTSFNQILSGLNENSNYMSNTNEPKVKKDILSKNVNKRRGSWWQVMNVTDERDYQLSNRRTPRYRGGCYGIQSKEEVHSAEYFARFGIAGKYNGYGMAVSFPMPD
ncbi:hypothetical protein Bhyg_17276, partial [Pseudolycoriella hygida]